MKKSIATKWVKALRSGKYEQGRKYLNCAGKFCCLGVLCELSGVVKKTENGGTVAYDGWTGVIPNSVKHWSGMRTEVGRWGSKYGMNSLDKMNDWGLVVGPDGMTKPLGRPFTFAEIADWIERNYKVL